MKVRRWFFGGILTKIVTLIFNATIHGQTNEWETFNTSTTKGGLAGDDVRAIAVDGDYVWFGTYGGGLCRYQKSINAWTTFNSSNSNILSDYVQAVAIDGDHVWIATTVSGVHRYDKATGQWTVLDSVNSPLPGNHVSTVEIDGDLVWFGTESGAACYRQSDGSWQVIHASSPGLGSNAINAIEAHGAEIWCGHNPGTLSSGWYTETFLNLFPPTDCLPEFLLATLSVKFPGGPNPSISRYRPSNNQWQNFEISEAGPDTLRKEKICFSVLSVAAREDEVWFGTVSKGVYRYHKSSGTFVNFNSTNSDLAGDLVWAIAFDEMYIWMGTFKQGVSRYKNPTSLWKTWRKSDGLVDEYVEDIDVLGDEAWFATRRGLSQLQISTEKWPNYSPFLGNYPNLLNWAIGVDTNTVWVGPILYQYEKSTNIWTKVDTSVSKLGNSHVYSIEVTDDKVWFGAEHDKISCYHKSTNNWTLFDSTITQFNSAIGAIDVSEDEVWFGGLGDGAGCYNQRTVFWSKFDTTNSGLTHNHVTSIATDGDFVWFGTYGGGISRFDKIKNEWVTFNSANTGIIFLNGI